MARPTWFSHSGVIAFVGSDLANDPQAIAGFSQREMGQAAMRTMRRFAEREVGAAGGGK